MERGEAEKVPPAWPFHRTSADEPGAYHSTSSRPSTVKSPAMGRLVLITDAGAALTPGGGTGTQLPRPAVMSHSWELLAHARPDPLWVDRGRASLPMLRVA